MKSFARFFLSILLLLMLSPTSGFTQNITLTTSPIAAANIAQGTNNNIVYIVKMDVATLAVNATDIQFTLTGTHDNNDLSTVSIYFNASAPSLTGASLRNSASALFAAPHAYNIFLGNNNIAAGASGYFIITVNTDAAATSGNTVKLNGAANPVTFTYSTSPTITNNQTDIAGIQTILAAGVTLTTSAIAAANIAQGTTNNIVYIVKMDVNALPVNATDIQFNLTGTHDNNDLSTVSIYFNAAAPSLTGATLKNSASALFAAPHFYNIFLGNNNIAAGASGYFIITVNTDAAATSGNTVKLNGAADPVTFTYSTSPTITNNQTDIAGIQTILAAGVTLTTSALAASNIAQGTTNNIVYIVKMDVAASAVNATDIQFTLTGTHDANDLTTVSIYFNASAPSLTGASFRNSASALFAAPHTYNIFMGNNNIAAGASGYFIITVNVDPAATNGNTVKLNGAADPVIFSFTTVPPVTNNQIDASGTQTIGGPLPLKLIDFKGTNMNTQEVQLQWITADELNTRDFEIEWSEDALHFTKIALVTAGNNGQEMHYSYLHKLPADGNNYYRLKMSDKDGHFTYSPVIKITVPVSTNKIIVRQNPVIDLLNLQVRALKNETIMFLLYSAEGKVIASRSFTVTKGNNLLSWDLQQVAAGNYFITSVNKLFETIKIIKN